MPNFRFGFVIPDPFPNFGTVLYVSKSGTPGDENGSQEKPFTTIQGALDSFGDSVDLAGFLQPYTLLVAPGNYDEDLLIPKGRIVSIFGLGTWTLGDGQAGSLNSTVPRNITFQPDTAGYAGAGANVKPALNLGVLPMANTTTTFVSTSYGCHISGDIIVADAGGFSHTINLYGVKLWGDMLKTVNVALTNLQMYQCYIVGFVTMTSGQTILEIAESCEFDKLVSVTNYNRLVHCELEGMTVTGTGTFISPSGMYGCDFAGTFTGPANSLRLDAVTNYFFNLNGALLGGAATKVLLHSEVI